MLFTTVISPVDDDGVRITVSPVAGIARFPAASVRVTFTSEPKSSPVTDASIAEVELIAETATFATASTTLIVKVWNDSAPESAAIPEVDDSFHTTRV